MKTKTQKPASPAEREMLGKIHNVKVAVRFMDGVYGLRRRKNRALLVAGRLTDLSAPLSVTLTAFVTQLAGGASVPACSNAKPVVSADGQETITSAPERSTESAGKLSR